MRCHYQSINQSVYLFGLQITTDKTKVAWTTKQKGMQTTDSKITDAYEYKSQTVVKAVPGGAQSSNIFLSLKPLKSDFTDVRKTLAGLIITFRVNGRRREMYCGHPRLCVSTSVRGRMPTLLHGF